jgi:hypothetical protein
MKRPGDDLSFTAPPLLAKTPILGLLNGSRRMKPIAGLSFA